MNSVNGEERPGELTLACMLALYYSARPGYDYKREWRYL
jgi:hypothetical protein